MDWEANLAAIIKCTDANLEQQFRHFEVASADHAGDGDARSGGGGGNTAAENGGNVAAAYLRETMATDYRHSQQQQPREIPSYSRASPAFSRDAPATSFAEHFHRRQERRHGAAKDNQRMHQGNYGVGAEERVSEGEDAGGCYPLGASSGGGVRYQMYASPTYDIAQMMEQVRLSLKLEVDARAAIAERQLSALLQLCKSTSEEMDRLRVEVCANDRQLHTLDQVQAKMRQELTTQKDIGFHLQSMCGKDESWRMQAENQLLELRQMVAALREQGNSTQAVAQEKLSRSELLVQFNAAMEPIKAQLQANLAHQAQQIAEVTRTTSSSSLLLDGLTQKVNRGLVEEINELRNDLSALKHVVTKMKAFPDARSSQSFDEQRSESAARSKEKADAKAKEDEEQLEKKLQLLREELVKELTELTTNYTDSQIKDTRKAAEDSDSKFVEKRDLEALQKLLDETCQGRCSSLAAQLDTHVKSAQQQLRSEWSDAARDMSDRLERSKQQMTDALTVAIDTKASACQSKHIDVIRLLEKEQDERKQAFDGLHEALRRSRHALEDQIHTLTQDSRSKASQHENDVEKRVKQVERQVEDVATSLEKDTRAKTESLTTTVEAQIGKLSAEWQQKLSAVNESLSKTNLSLSSLSDSVASSASTALATTVDAKSDTTNKEASSVLEKQASVYVSTMENLLHKVQLQLQLQAQSQAQMTMPPSPFHGYWPPSPFASSQPAPVLQTPPTMLSPMFRSSTAAQPESTAVESAKPENVPPAPATSRSGLMSTSEVLPAAEVLLQPKCTSNDSTEALEAGLASDTAFPAALPARSVSAPATSVSRQSRSDPPPVLEVLHAAESSDDATMSTSGPSGACDDDQAGRKKPTTMITAKGALAEAELAKARVENRRRQCMEFKLQQPPIGPISDLPVTQIAHMASNSPDDTINGLRRASVPVVLAGCASSSGRQGPSLVRAVSSSALQQEDSSVRVPVSSPQSVLTTEPSAPTPTTANATGGELEGMLSQLSPPIARSPVNVQASAAGTNGTTTGKSTLGSPSIMANKPTGASPSPMRESPPASNSETTTSPELALDNQCNFTESSHRPLESQSRPSSAPEPSSARPSLPTPAATGDTHQQRRSPLARIFARPPSFSSGEVAGSSSNEDPLAPPKSATAHSTAPLSAATSVTQEFPTQVTVEKSTTRSSSRGESVASASHVLCALCRLPIRADLKAEHEENQCSKRIMKCGVCHQQVQHCNLKTHKSSCHPPVDSNGLRSEKDLGAHALIDEEKIEASVKTDITTEDDAVLSKCRNCATDVASLGLLEHEVNCDKMLKQCPHCLRRQKMSELQEHIENCDCRLVSCPNDCGSKFLQRGIPNHLATRCPKKKALVIATAPTSSPPSSNPTPTSPIAPPPSVPPPTEKVECKFCDDEITASEIDVHEQSCDWKPKRCQHCNMVIISRDLVRHETSCRTNLKNCQHCNESVPQSTLSTHTARCSKRPIKCIRCCQLFAADSIVAHSTNCKFVPGASPLGTAPPPPSQQVHKQTPLVPDRRTDTSGTQQTASRTSIKIPPPPAFPPPPTSVIPSPAAQSISRRASADPRLGVGISDDAVNAAAPIETLSERMTRRNLALSQLTNPGSASISDANFTTAEHNTGGRARDPSPHFGTTSPMEVGSELDAGQIDEEFEDDEDEEDEEDGQLTLAQVVAEWNVDNVCLWLHEDVGVPEVVARFEQQQCSGEMLLDLSESDLINDFGINNRNHRERIMNAIEAIKTSDGFSDSDEDDDEEEENDDRGDDDNDDEDDNAYGSGVTPLIVSSSSPNSRHSFGGAPFVHPRDILRRRSQPASHQTLDGSLTSSNAMLRRISDALESPKR